MKSVLRVLRVAILLALVAACAQAKNNGARVGKGSNTRSTGAPINGAGNIQVNATGAAQFFSNYQNSDGTPFAVPCGFSQVYLSAQTGSSARLQMDFLLSCMGQNTDGSQFNDLQVVLSSDQSSFAGASTTQAGNMTSVTFQDDMSTITLQGTIQGQTYSGQVIYSNYYYIQASGMQGFPGAQNTIGSFSIPTCSVFQCN